MKVVWGMTYMYERTSFLEGVLISEVSCLLMCPD